MKGKEVITQTEVDFAEVQNEARGSRWDWEEKLVHQHLPSAVAPLIAAYLLSALQRLLLPSDPPPVPTLAPTSPQQ